MRELTPEELLLVCGGEAVVAPDPARPIDEEQRRIELQLAAQRGPVYTGVNAAHWGTWPSHASGFVGKDDDNITVTGYHQRAIYTDDMTWQSDFALDQLDDYYIETQFNESDLYYAAHADEIVPVFGVEAPDGATYYAPKGFDYAKVMAAIAYLRSIPNYDGRLSAFHSMYTDRNHPHFLDLKDLPGPEITYYSEAKGGIVSGGSAYEPFGNYLYGFVGRAGGIGSGDLRFAAGLTQSGGRNIFSQDAPEDVPHVNLGIEDAERFLNGQFIGPDPREPSFPGEPRAPGVPVNIG